MKINRKKLSGALAAAGYIIQFPGFFIYHWFVSTGMPSYLEGYTVRVAVLTMPLLAISYAISYSGYKRGRRLDLAVLFFSAFIAIWSVAFGLTKNPTAALDYIGASLVWISYYFNIRLMRLGEKWAQYVYMPSILVAAIVVALNIKNGIFTLGVGSQIVTYQGFALILMVMTLLAMASYHAVSVIWGLWIASIAMLFLIGARSEFAALIIGGAIYLALLRGGVVLKSILLVTSLAAVIWNIGEFETYTQNRVVRLLETGAHENRIDRQYAFDYAIEVINTNPLMGNFGQYPDGLFAHNALAAWADFGIFGFLYLIVLVGNPFVRSIKLCSSRDRTNESILATSTLLSAMFLLVSAKTFVYFLVPVALGISRLAFSNHDELYSIQRSPQV